MYVIIQQSIQTIYNNLVFDSSVAHRLSVGHLYLVGENKFCKVLSAHSMNRSVDTSLSVRSSSARSCRHIW
jgi:hypothetical protein